jgi:hypothetical protein
MEKKETNPKKGVKPAHTVRQGAIAANIWLRQSQTGFVYYDYSISRSWKSTKAGKEGYSQNFFPDNKMQLLEVVAEASDWIAERMANAETVVLDAA